VFKTAIAALALAAGAAQAQTATAISSNNASPNGHFGQSATYIPDVNGDGIADFAIGADDEAVGGNPVAGRVHIYSGATGALLRTINPPTAQQLGTFFGWSLCGTPDMNGDGKGDLLVGAIWEKDLSNLVCGRAYLFSGATGAMLRAWLPPGTHQDSQNFGFAVTTIPDVTGDGTVDFAIAAEGEQVGAITGAGRVHIYNGATGAFIRSLSSPTPETNAAFGFSIAGMGDITGDGKGELVVGAPFQNPGAAPTDCGRVYVIGGNGTLLRAMGSPGSADSGFFGKSVSVIASLNSDNLPDILVGAPGEPQGNTLGAGHAYVFAGVTYLFIKSSRSPFPITNANYGLATSPMRDAAGAPTTEYIVSEPTSGRGKIYIYNPNRGFQTVQALSGARCGWSVAGMGDLNTNGQADFVFGAPLDGAGGHGRAYLVK